MDEKHINSTEATPKPEVLKETLEDMDKWDMNTMKDPDGK